MNVRSLPPNRLLRRGGLAAASLSCLVAACSSTPPREQLAVSRAAVERANGPAAADAPLELTAARDKVARANVAMAQKDYVLARQLAEQAEADATLAEAQARSSRSDRALGEVQESIRQLRQQMQQQANPSASQP